MQAESFVAAVVQAAPVYLDRDATGEKAVRLIQEAASEGARLVAFPETWIPGYPSWIYHAAEWNEPRSKRAYARLQRNAVQVPGPATGALCRAAGGRRPASSEARSTRDRKSTRLNSSHTVTSYAVFCSKK